MNPVRPQLLIGGFVRTGDPEEPIVFTENSEHSVSEVARYLGVTPQRVRQICATSPESCRMSDAGWRLERDFVAKLVLDRLKRKLRRRGTSAAAPGHDLSGLAEAAIRLAGSLEEQDARKDEISRLRQELENAQETNAVLRKEVADLRKQIEERESVASGPAPRNRSGQGRAAHEESGDKGYILGSRAPRLRRDGDRTPRSGEPE